jgi:YfiR/HmsC-like
MRQFLYPIAKRVIRRGLARCSFACAVLLLAATAGAPRPSIAEPVQGGQALEQRVKAAFLYKFLGYTDFPASAFTDPSSPVTIVVAGSDEMAAELGALTAGRSVNNHPIAVRTLRENETGATAHLLFAAGTDCARAARVIRGVRALLVVTECDNGLQQGSVINFRIVDERVRFDVGLDAAEKNGVKLSSRLLTVANHVQKVTP